MSEEALYLEFHGMDSRYVLYGSRSGVELSEGISETLQHMSLAERLVFVAMAELICQADKGLS